MSLIIIGTSVAASLRAFGSYAVGRRAFEEKAVGLELANQLMAEINRLPFAEGSTIGLDNGESSTNRSTFDDIDDYNGWNVSPPRDRNNASVTQYSGYRQQVTVAWDTSIPNPGTGNWSANTFKRITVKILKDDKVLTTLITVRSNNNAAN